MSAALADPARLAAFRVSRLCIGETCWIGLTQVTRNSDYSYTVHLPGHCRRVYRKSVAKAQRCVVQMIISCPVPVPVLVPMLSSTTGTHKLRQLALPLLLESA
jgi:hypothetical protein